MNQREITVMVVTNETNFSLEDFPRTCSEDYLLKPSAVVSPEQFLELLSPPNKDQPFPDVFLLKEDLSATSREEIIEARKQTSRIRQRPVLLQNTPEATYADTTVASLDRIYHVDDEISQHQFRQVLLDLQAFWYPEIAG